MNTAEIVIREVQGDGGLMVREFLAEGVGQSCQATNLHPQALNAALTEVPKLLAAFVVAFSTGHGLLSACVEREKPYNMFGSGVRLTPRSGLAPTPVQAEGGGTDS